MRYLKIFRWSFQCSSLLCSFVLCLRSLDLVEPSANFCQGSTPLPSPSPRLYSQDSIFTQRSLRCSKMRQTQIFSGSSHPLLVEGICDRLGMQPGEAELGKFSNGETKVHIQTSIRNQDVFIVQSGSSKINDAVFELLIMVSACKGGSAKSITGKLLIFSRVDGLLTTEQRLCPTSRTPGSPRRNLIAELSRHE